MYIIFTQSPHQQTLFHMQRRHIPQTSNPTPSSSYQKFVTISQRSLKTSLHFSILRIDTIPIVISANT